MFSLAMSWKMRPDNPALSFRRRLEVARDRFPFFGEIERLANALAVDEDQRAASIIRLCIRTGARPGGARSATFDRFNFDLAIGTKLAAYTWRGRTRSSASPGASAPRCWLASSGSCRSVVWVCPWTPAMTLESQDDSLTADLCSRAR